MKIASRVIVINAIINVLLALALLQIVFPVMMLRKEPMIVPVPV